jgi:hypothetical protein
MPRRIDREFVTSSLVQTGIVDLARAATQRGYTASLISP